FAGSRGAAEEDADLGRDTFLDESDVPLRPGDRPERCSRDLIHRYRLLCGASYPGSAMVNDLRGSCWTSMSCCVWWGRTGSAVKRSENLTRAVNSQPWS